MGVTIKRLGPAFHRINHRYLRNSFWISVKMAEASLSATTTVVKRKGRATKHCAEAYCLVLSLSWNDIVVNGGKNVNETARRVDQG